jgi:hypothetical protein
MLLARCVRIAVVGRRLGRQQPSRRDPAGADLQRTREFPVCAERGSGCPWCCPPAPARGCRPVDGSHCYHVSRSRRRRQHGIDRFEAGPDIRDASSRPNSDQIAARTALSNPRTCSRASASARSAWPSAMVRSSSTCSPTCSSTVGSFSRNRQKIRVARLS